MRGGTLSRLVEIQRLLRQVLIKVQIAADGEHGAAWDPLNCLKAQIDLVEIQRLLRQVLIKVQIAADGEHGAVFEEDDAA